MSDFKITKSHVEHAIEEWRFLFRFDRRKWEVTVCCKDGIVFGSHHTNVSTSDMEYFHFPVEVREDHFNQFKKIINDKRRERQIQQETTKSVN